MNQALRLSTFDKARAQMLIRHPFFAAVVLSSDWIADEKVGTACTDMVKVWYNPKFMDSLSVDHAMFVMIHEIMHIILMHGIRRGSRKPRRWNHAGDYAINQELVDAGLPMLKITQLMIDNGIVKPGQGNVGDTFGLLDVGKYQGLAAEQIYDMLEQEAQDEKKGRGKGERQGSDNQGKGEPDDDEDQGLDDLLETVGKTQAEIHEIKDNIKQKIAQAAVMARAAGKLPANLALLVDGILNPPQPWESILREFMTRMVQSNETWNRRNRRYAVMLPSRHDTAMGELVIIGDTSGSMMQDKIFAQIAAEINYCNEFVRPERTRVVWADDAECSGEQVFEPGELVVLEPKGGGGTDMRQPLKFVEKYDPCCVILVTDCYTPWPDEATPFPLIVASTTTAASPHWASRLQLRVGE